MAREFIPWPAAGHMEGILLELLPLQTALAGMHGVGVLLRLVAPMALAVG
jgi:hypothetical protein